MNHSIYRVISDQRHAGHWKLEHDGEILDSRSDKEEAVGQARRLARENQPSQLFIHATNGKIETEHTYKDGAP